MLHDPAPSERLRDGAIARIAAIAAANADDVDREARFPIEAITAMREEGLLGSMIPRRLGGHGSTIAEIASQTQQLARACASTAMIYAMHQNQVACVVECCLHEPWYREFAGRIAEEQLLVASITSEVGIGGDMRSSLCALEIADGRFTLTKQAPTVSYGAYADVLFVTSRANPGVPASDQLLTAVFKDQCALEQTGEWDAHGMRGTCSDAFAFSGEGPVEQILPVPFADLAAEAMVPVSHLLWSAVWTGIAAEALSRARNFLRTQARRQPGVPLPGASRLMAALGQLELIQSRIARMIASYDRSHALGSDRGAIDYADAGWPSGLAGPAALNTLKCDASEMCHDVVLQAMRICGMAGYRNGTDFSLGRHLRDILSAQLMINNDRLSATTGMLLLAQRTDLGTL